MNSSEKKSINKLLTICFILSFFFCIFDLIIGKQIIKPMMVHMKYIFQFFLILFNIFILYPPNILYITSIS